MTIVIGHVWKYAGDARAVFLLHKHIPMISVQADGREDNRNPLSSEVLAGYDAGGIVVNAAYCDITREINFPCNGLLKPKGNALDFSRRNTLRYEIVGQRQCLVLPQIP